MYELIPQKTNKKAQRVIIILFLGASALLALSALLEGMSYLWAVQLLAVLLLVAAVFLVARYTSKIYIYRIDGTDREVDLTVAETSPSGKRRNTVCRIGLSTVRKRVLLEGKDCALSSIRKEKKPIYDYRPDLYPDKSILILSDEGGVEVYICLAYEENLFELLAPTENSEDEDEN